MHLDSSKSTVRFACSQRGFGQRTNPRVERAPSTKVSRGCSVWTQDVAPGATILDMETVMTLSKNQVQDTGSTLGLNENTLTCFPQK